MADLIHLPEKNGQPAGELEEANLSTHTIRANTPNRDTSIGKDGATTPVVLVPLPPPPPSPNAKTSKPASSFYKFDRPRSVRRLDSDKSSKRQLHMKNVGIVIGDFKGMFPDELSLAVGERIDIISKDTRMSRNIGWWTAKNSRGKIGIFPSSCVKVVSNLSEAHAVSLPSEYPLEIPCSEVDLKEVIGVGGFGKVHRAMYKGEEVAVKVAKMTTFDSLKAVQEVISEAEKFLHLAHTNVCALVGVVLVKDVCLVMEYARGGALSEVLHKKGLSVPIDVILDWATQIASGMNYLHHEACPSLIHRDLKSSNILLSNKLDPTNLRGNTVKITDFGLAREIEHTTYMSGAGTYPWMAPEVIRSSDFSKKSDVWSYAVVLWELLTGERPYYGLNLFVVAYGVGHGTLSLPIPDGCPEDLRDLMRACWEREYPKRPSFTRILEILKEAEGSAFFSTTSDEVFRSIQSSWKEEIQQVFTELKKKENELRAREDELRRRLSDKEQALMQKEELIQKQVEMLDKKAIELNRQLEHLEELKGKERPPRLKRFTLKGLWRRWFSDRPTEKFLPSQVEAQRANSSSRAARSSTTPDHPAKQQTRSRHSGTSSYHRRQRSDGHSEGYNKEHLSLPLATDSPRRVSVPPSPEAASLTAKAPMSNALLSEGGTLQALRQRSMSDIHSLSTQQQQQQQVPRGTSTLPQMRAMSTSVLHPPPASDMKPAPLSLRTKPPHDSSPSSPNITLTQYDRGIMSLNSMQYDSGNSMTCSDASGHSNFSESHPLMEMESPVSAPPSTIDEFDPLRHSVDSLLSDPYCSTTSGIASPNILSTSTFGKTSPRQTSPRNSLTIIDPNPSIVRQRPRGLSIAGSEPSFPMSAPSSRPHSPRTILRCKSSPTGSVRSLITFPTSYDSDTGIGGYLSDVQSDSDTSLLDWTDYHGGDPNYPLIPDPPIPTPRQLEVDLFNPTMSWVQQLALQPP